MEEEFTFKSAKNLTDDEIYMLLSPEDKKALNLGKKLKYTAKRRRYIKYGIILILIALATVALIYNYL